MKNIPTKNLSEELETRAGVTTVQVIPHEKIEIIHISRGPAIKSINKD
ncbi:BC1881 family protein [Bacillus cereus]